MQEGYRTDRRKNKRLQVHLSVLYQILGPEHVYNLLQGRRYEAKTLDLSNSGVSILSGHYLPKGTRISLKFVIFESEVRSTMFYEVLGVTAEVCHCQQGDDCQFKLGFQFRNLKPDDLQVIEDIVSSPLKYADNSFVCDNL